MGSGDPVLPWASQSLPPAIHRAAPLSPVPGWTCVLASISQWALSCLRGCSSHTTQERAALSSHLASQHRGTQLSLSTGGTGANAGPGRDRPSLTHVFAGRLMLRAALAAPADIGRTSKRPLSCFKGKTSPGISADAPRECRDMARGRSVCPQLQETHHAVPRRCGRALPSRRSASLRFIARPFAFSSCLGTESWRLALAAALNYPLSPLAWQRPCPCRPVRADPMDARSRAAC